MSTGPCSPNSSSTYMRKSAQRDLCDGQSRLCGNKTRKVSCSCSWHLANCKKVQGKEENVLDVQLHSTKADHNTGKQCVLHQATLCSARTLVPSTNLPLEALCLYLINIILLLIRLFAIVYFAPFLFFNFF
jgi:hypothetical protein